MIIEQNDVQCKYQLLVLATKKSVVVKGFHVNTKLQLQNVYKEQEKGQLLSLCFGFIDMHE